MHHNAKISQVGANKKISRSMSVVLWTRSFTINV